MNRGRNETMNIVAAAGTEERKNAIETDYEEDDLYYMSRAHIASSSLLNTHNASPAIDNTTPATGVESYHGHLEQYFTTTMPKPLSTHIMSYLEFVYHVADDNPLPVYVRGREEIGAGCYLVLRQCGKGGYGTVYDSLLLNHSQTTDRHPVFQQPECGMYLHVAMKIATQEYTYAEPELMKALSGVNGVCYLLEDDIIVPTSLDRRTHHPKITWGQCSYYIVTPFITAASVTDVRSDPTLLHMFTHKLLTALATLHSVWLVHMDVKMGNFLMDKEGHAALIDLGLSVFRDGCTAPCNACGRSQTNHASSCSLREWKSHVLVAGHQPLLYDIPGYDEVLSHRQVLLGYVDHVTDKLPPNRLPTYTVNTNAHITTGTPGYRAPEALLLWRHISTAFDVWCAGIVILMVMCRQSHSFFKEIEIKKAITQLFELVGEDGISDAATSIGARCAILGHITNTDHVLSSNTHRTTQVQRLKAFVLSRSPHDGISFPHSLYDLVSVMLEPNPYRRITSKQALCSVYIVRSE